MMTNIAAAVLGAITIICLAAFRFSQRRKKMRFREELVSKYRVADENAEKEAGR